MSDLDPAAIERLLQDGARRRGVPVNAYRDLVQTKADIAGSVNAGAKMHRRTGVKMHHGGLPA